MSEAVVATGGTEIIESMIVDVNNAAITGLTDIKIECRRKSDGKLIDWNDMTFKSSGWTTRQLALTETDATNEAGWYRYLWNMGSIVSPVANDVYTITTRQTSLTTAANVPQFGVIRTGAFVDTIATIQTDTDDIQTRLPAALVSGRMDSSVGAVAAGAITAAAIASNAITAAKIATDAIGASQLAADAVTEIQSGLGTSAEIAGVQADVDDLQTRVPAALVGGRMDSSVGAVAANAITAAAIAADAITSAKIAPGAIGSSEAPLLANLDVASSTLATAAALALVATDVDDVQTRLPASLVAGRIDASVGAMAAGTVTAAAVATDAIDADALAASAVTEIQAGLATSAALTTMQGNVTTILGYGAPPTAEAAAAAVWATADGTGTMGASLALLRRRQTNKRVLSGVGVLSFYADDGTTVEKTATVTDVDGAAVTIVAGDPARSTAEA